MNPEDLDQLLSPNSCAVAFTECKCSSVVLPSMLCCLTRLKTENAAFILLFFFENWYLSCHSCPILLKQQQMGSCLFLAFLFSFAIRKERDFSGPAECVTY